MIEYNVYRINDINMRAMSNFIMNVKKDSGQWREETHLDNVEMSMNRNFADTEDIVLIAQENEEPLGFLMLHQKEGKKVEINPWFLSGLPIVRQDGENLDISTQLIIRAINHAREGGITRVEMSFPREKHSKQIKSLLQQCGLTLVEEIVHMRRNISELTINAPMLQESIERRPLLQVNRRDLFACWSEAFEQGQDRSFLSRSKEERRAFFDEAFDFSEGLIEAACIALINDLAVIGFSLTRPTHGERNGHLWQMGIHPNYRRRGLAKYLLSEVKEQLKELKFTTMSLNVDVENLSAHKLYKECGLQEDWSLVSYAWYNSKKVY